MFRILIAICMNTNVLFNVVVLRTVILFPSTNPFICFQVCLSWGLSKSQSCGWEIVTLHTNLRYYHSFVYLENYKTAQTIIIDLDSFVDFVIFGRKKDNYSTVIKKTGLKTKKILLNSNFVETVVKTIRSVAALLQLCP